MADLYSSLRKCAGWAAAFPFYWAGSTALILGKLWVRVGDELSGLDKESDIQI